MSVNCTGLERVHDELQVAREEVDTYHRTLMQKMVKGSSEVYKELDDAYPTDTKVSFSGLAHYITTSLFYP